MGVAWTSISVTTSKGTTAVNSDDFPVPAILDSGTVLTYVPRDIFTPVQQFLGAQVVGNSGVYAVAW